MKVARRNKQQIENNQNNVISQSEAPITRALQAFDKQEKIKKFNRIIKNFDPNSDEKIDPINHPEFKNYKEQQIYVIKYLKQQGVDIYDPNNTPGMYLHKKGEDSVGILFNDTKNNKQKKQEIIENQDNINNEDLDNFFK